ncbi:hypothetical protein B0H14DRAFT_3673363 [Mycena olivaceomarginata]|nr:hypothetical protein B0H14DRAFT_3673363 [Mycena olivaceomarginata]
MASEVIENLAYLSKYLDQSRARVSELEKELTNVRLEGEAALEEMRKKANETQDLQGAANDGLVAASAERYALLKTKYKQVKEDKTSLRGSLAEQDAQINCLKEKVSQIKAEYEAANSEKEELQQTLRELLEVVEGLQKEVEEVGFFFVTDKFSRLSFPNPHDEESDSCLCPAFSYLAYGPTCRYERATKTWVEGSDLIGFHGGTRELFVQNNNFIVYAGTYKCYDLRPLHPTGTDPPPCISRGEIIDAALGIPPLQNHPHI